MRGEWVDPTRSRITVSEWAFSEFLAAPLACRCEGRKRDELVFVGPDGGVLRSGNFRRRQFAAAVAACRAVTISLKSSPKKRRASCSHSFSVPATDPCVLRRARRNRQDRYALAGTRSCYDLHRVHCD